MKLYVDAGTTWSKVCELSDGSSDFSLQYKDYLKNFSEKIG